MYLATLGPPAAHSARVGFATNLFAAGGVAVRTGPVEGFAATGLSVACLCGSDRSYAEEASGAARTLAGARDVRENSAVVDAVLFTHAHADHILGIDDLRQVNRVTGRALEAVGTRTTLQKLDDRARTRSGTASFAGRPTT